MQILKGGSDKEEELVALEKETVELVGQIKDDVLANLHLESVRCCRIYAATASPWLSLLSHENSTPIMIPQAPLPPQVDLAFTNYQAISNIGRDLNPALKDTQDIAKEVRAIVKGLKEEMDSLKGEIRNQVEKQEQAKEAMMPQGRTKAIDEGKLKITILNGGEPSCESKDDEKLGPLTVKECESVAISKEGEKANFGEEEIETNPPGCILYDNGKYRYNDPAKSNPTAKKETKDPEKEYPDVSKCGGEKPEGEVKVSCVCAEVGDGEEQGLLGRAASAVGGLFAAERISDADELERSHARALGSEELTDSQRDLQAPVEEALESLERAMDARS